MRRFIIVSASIVMLVGCSTRQQPEKSQVPNARSSSPPRSLVSGIDMQSIDTSIRAQDDFYRHVNGRWLTTVEIPADEQGYGTGSVVFNRVQDQLHKAVDDAANGNSLRSNVDMKKVGDLYASFMDEARLDELGATPLYPKFAKIDAAKDSKAIAALVAAMNRDVATISPYGLASNAPVNIEIHQDNDDASHYVVDLQQGGLGLPDRDYYLKDDDTKLKSIRDAYRKHVERMFLMTGDENAALDADEVLAFETSIAGIEWDSVTLRDRIKAYNKEQIRSLMRLAPGFDWDAFVDAAGIRAKVDTVVIGQPSYLIAFAKLAQRTPVATWRAYFRWHTLSDFAPELSKPFADEDFAFNGTVLRDVPENRARWRRGIAVVNASLGDELGKLYIADFFPPESKVRAQKLVKNLLSAFSQSIDTLDWMSAQTKQAAHNKLAKYLTKIGYPDTWQDYSLLTIDRGDLIGNISRAAQFEYHREINKLGKPIDRGEWSMAPQMLDAYYNSELNEIVFPAAILQPPFFDPDADDAVNYGGIGAIIGHEISHGFDDQGSRYDGEGNLRNWWTEEDHAKFDAKTKILVAEYSAFEPVPGYHIDGMRTLGENIADNSGLAVAYKAYQISLGGKPAVVIDTLTGDQRFYMAFAQLWREKARDKATIAHVESDPHSTPMYRVMGTMVNQPAFFAAFDVREGDKMWRAPNQRAIIW